jgi:DNA-directed RNA polymerase subunit RPC12/RpoP
MSFIAEYIIDLSKMSLSKMHKNGTFPCPNCGNKISPKDKKDENSEIVTVEFKTPEGYIEVTPTQAKLMGDKINTKNLVSIKVRCKRCEKKIKIIGFLDSQENPLFFRARDEVAIWKKIVLLKNTKGKLSFAERKTILIFFQQKIGEDKIVKSN